MDSGSSSSKVSGRYTPLSYPVDEYVKLSLSYPVDKYVKGKGKKSGASSSKVRGISFYLDSTVNKFGLIRKMDKNSIPLSFYTTTLVYHPRRRQIDIFVANVEEVDKHPLSFYMDPNAYHRDGFLRVNYCPLSMGSTTDSGCPDWLCINYIPRSMDSTAVSKSSQSKSVAAKGKGQSSKSKVSRRRIPDIVALSILSKLSIKSLKRFGCVRKSWSILFENTDFMTVYSNHFISRHGSDDDYHTFILTNHLDDDNCYHSEFLLPQNTLKFNVPSPLNNLFEDITCILGSTSVNGIFCLGKKFRTTMKSRYVLWNPLTQESMVVPPSPAELTPKDRRNGFFPEHVFHGFGYDQLTDDFKVIQYMQFGHTSDTCQDYYNLLKCFVEIYSLKSDSWRMIHMEKDLCQWDLNFYNSEPFQGLEVYVDGACHWLVLRLVSSRRVALTLLSFDLSDEVFLTTPIGEEPYSPYNHYARRHLTVLNGSIALISNYHDDIVFQISILGELGVSESWTKLYIYGPLPSIQWPPIGFGKMGYLFITKKDYEVAYVDLSTQIIEEVGITGENTSYFNCGLYKESLLSIGGSSN